MFGGPVGRGIPSAYPLAVVPALSKEESSHALSLSKALSSAPCDNCAFRRGVSWRNTRLAEIAIERVRDLKAGDSLICHRSAELKNNEYVPCDHSRMCAGAVQFFYADRLREKDDASPVFQSRDEMLAYHAAVTP